MSAVILGALAAVCLVAAGGLIRMRRRRLPVTGSRSAPDPSSVFPEVLGLQVGDVVLRGTEELWLVGALVMRDTSECVAGLFFGSHAGGSGQATAVVVLPGPPRRVAWVKQIRDEPTSLVLASFEHAGEQLRRKGKLAIGIESYGDTPDLGAGGTGVWAQYDGRSGAVGFVLSSEQRSVIWHGEWLFDDELMRLAAGKATIERTS